jgi:hypothetical protein
MGMNLLSQSQLLFDNYNERTPMDWSVSSPYDFTIPRSSWFSTGQIILQAFLQLRCDLNLSIAPSNSVRYLNPAQYQLGHWAAAVDNNVIDDGRMKYLNQGVRYASAPIQIIGGQHDEALIIGNTTNSRAGHAQSISDSPICGTARGLVVEAPLQSVADMSLSLPKGAICLQTALGQTEFRQITQYEGTNQTISLSLEDLTIPSVYSGVIWGGVRLSANLLVYVEETSSDANRLPAAPFIVGRIQPAVYSYTCEFGVPIPDPGNPPCNVPGLIYQTVPGVDGGAAGIVACDDTQQ